MLDIYGRLSALRRPRLLIRAARIGAVDYCRDRHLPRLLGHVEMPRPPLAVLQLMEQEHELDQRRQDNDPGYPLTRHVEVLIALMGEAQLLSQNRITQDPEQATTDPGSHPIQTLCNPI